MKTGCPAGSNDFRISITQVKKTKNVAYDHKRYKEQLVFNLLMHRSSATGLFTSYFNPGMFLILKDIRSYLTFYITSILSILFVSCIATFPVGPSIPPSGFYEKHSEVFNGTYDEVWAATIAALEALDWRIQNQDELSGIYNLKHLMFTVPNSMKRIEYMLNPQIGRSRIPRSCLI